MLGPPHGARRVALVTLLLAACGPAPATEGRAYCASALVHAGVATTIASPAGASITTSERSFTADTTVGLCVVVTGRTRGQRSDTYEITLSGPARSVFTVTLPVDAGTTVVEAQRAIESGATFVDREPGVAAEGRATFHAIEGGLYRLVEGRDELDAGPPPNDAAVVGPDDVNRPDAPRPVGPVVVGPDLAPARYDCLGADPIGGTGPQVSADLVIRGLLDGQLRANAGVNASPEPPWQWPTMDCPACNGGATDETGHGTVLLTPGHYWLYVFTLGSSTPTYDLAGTWMTNVRFPVGATSVEAVGVSMQDEGVLRGVAQGFGYAVGRARDCDGAPVQRVEVRAYDPATNLRLTQGIDGSSAVRYGANGGLPISVGERTTSDGTYFVARSLLGELVRIEAWGRLTPDGSDVLLACEELSFAGGIGLVVDLPPLAADASASCGSAP